MPVTNFHCHACGAIEQSYIAIGARGEESPTLPELDEFQLVNVELYDAGVRLMPLLAPVFANDTDHEPVDYKVDPDVGPLLRACVQCGTVRMMTRDER